MDKGHIHHLVLRPPNWLGDVIMSQPAMRAVSQGIKPDRISMVGRPWLADLLPFLSINECSYCTEIPPDTDMGVLFTNNFRSAWQLWRSGIPQRIGFHGQWRRLLLTSPIKPDLDMAREHHRSYFLNLAEQMGFAIADREVSIQAPETEMNAGRLLVRGHNLSERRTVCVAPGAQFGGAKRYPPETYAVILRELHRLGWHLLVMGTGEDVETCNHCLHGITTHAWNAAGKTTLREAIQILSVTRLLLCNDSGLMHVAAGLGLPVVAIFGATDPERTAPSGRHVTLLYQPADCSPCLQRECTVPGHPCMTNITPESVLGACLKWLF